MTTFAQAFGRRVGDERRARGWTQYDLAAKSGINQKCLSEYENGLVAIRLERAVAIAGALEVPLGRLIAEVTR